MFLAAFAYFYRKLQAYFAPRSLWPARLTCGLLVCFAALPLSYGLLMRGGPRLEGFFAPTHPSTLTNALLQTFFIGGYALLGLWGSFLLFSLALDLTAVCWRWVKPQTATSSASTPNNNTDDEHLLRTSRRAFLASPSVGVLGLSSATSAWGGYQAFVGPEVKKVSVALPALPKSWQGLRIAQISDLHIGPLIHLPYVQQVVTQVLALKPDIIAVTGDLVDGTPSALREALAPLADLKAPYGCYYVTGNHEYYWGAESWIEAMRGCGWIPLINEHQWINAYGLPVMIAGVCDTSAEQFIAAHRSDPAKAARTLRAGAGITPSASARGDEGEGEQQAKILLAHRPNSCWEAAQAGFDLQLSGHTHAGQFFPWNGLVKLVHRYSEGLYTHEKMALYVNAGTGYWGPPHRFLIPSEITLLELTGAQNTSGQ